MQPTPKIFKADFTKVYEPAEDSFLLLDALEKDIEFLQKRDPLLVVEIGSGSGICITFLQQLLGTRLCIATDINPYACQVTTQTSRLNQTDILTINTKFIQNTRLQGMIDLLIFNPPYVLSMDNELDCNDLRASFAGGKDGRTVIDEFLGLEILAPNGVLYIVLVNENKPLEIVEMMKVKGYQVDLILYRVAGWEGLSVYRFIRGS